MMGIIWCIALILTIGIQGCASKVENWGTGSCEKAHRLISFTPQSSSTLIVTARILDDLGDKAGHCVVVVNDSLYVGESDLSGRIGFRHHSPINSIDIIFVGYSARADSLNWVEGGYYDVEFCIDYRNPEIEVSM